MNVRLVKERARIHGLMCVSIAVVEGVVGVAGLVKRMICAVSATVLANLTQRRIDYERST